LQGRGQNEKLWNEEKTGAIQSDPRRGVYGERKGPEEGDHQHALRPGGVTSQGNPPKAERNGKKKKGTEKVYNFRQPN